MNRTAFHILSISVLLLLGNGVAAQPRSQNFDKVWVQGEGITYSTRFDSGTAPVNQIMSLTKGLYFAFGNSGICDSSGKLLLVSNGYSLFDSNLDAIDNSGVMAPPRFSRLMGAFSTLSQSSIILPFANNIYRHVTPAVSDDSCRHNWESSGNGSYYDLMLYNEVHMNANSGAGTVTKRMVPLLEKTRLSKTQMMACRHGDGRSWWLLKKAADTNLYYKFLFTEDDVYGPYVQGFSGEAARTGEWDADGQSVFSRDGTRFASTSSGYGHVFVADFDRCTGVLSHPKVYKVPPRLAGNLGETTELDSSTTGAAFSPNGRFLYVSGYFNVQQLDLQSTPTSAVWTHLSGMDTTRHDFMEYTGVYAGHDGKLYIGNWAGYSGAMNVIDNPDLPGTAAGFCRKCLRFPGYLDDTVTRFAGVSTPPCMPNYGLGPSSPICYPLGINAQVVEHMTFSLYPNPATSQVEVKSFEAGTLTLLDIMGRTVTSLAIRGSEAQPIDVRNLKSGLYQYRFVRSSRPETHGKLLIVR